MVWESVWLSGENERDFGGVHEFSLIAHHLWWFQSLLILGRKCDGKREFDGKLPINPHLFPLMCVLDLFIYFFLRIRICCKLSCSNSCKMHMYQVTIRWKIQSWYESFHLNISLDKCVSEALTYVHFYRSCCNLIYNKSLAFFIWTSKFFSLIFFILCNRGMKINLNKLHFLSSHFYSQPNKRVFSSFYFSILPIKHEEKLNLFHTSTKWK